MAGEIGIHDLASMLGGRIVGDAGGKGSLLGTCAVDSYVKGKVSFIKNAKYGEMLARLHDAVIVAPENLFAFCEKYPQNTYIVVKDVASSMMNVQEFFYGGEPLIAQEGISQSARVEDGATVGPGAYIGENVYIGRNVTIDENAKVLHNSCIFDDVVVGKGTHIYPGVCIYRGCEIGQDCVIHSGARIGSDGFRFEQDIEAGVVRKMYHMGNVIIGDRVEIGANAAIDRASFEGGATTLSDDVKIDNLVHIGHNATIGTRTMIAAMSCIGGSDVIGEDVWIGIGATISHSVRVGSRAKILLNAVVAYDVPDDEMVSGFYAMPHKQWKRAYGKLKGEQ